MLKSKGWLLLQVFSSLSEDTHFSVPGTLQVEAMGMHKSFSWDTLQEGVSLRCCRPWDGERLWENSLPGPSMHRWCSWAFSVAGFWSFAGYSVLLDSIHVNSWDGHDPHWQNSATAWNVWPGADALESHGCQFKRHRAGGLPHGSINLISTSTLWI